ncbi:Hypothetical predicted protein [Cloeon dipterum]|uniref:Uncharacterized protein n=1 Tax=Cloeon dipterum TaxID=197152 RepID=A0A8S1DP10_9INSE|nr:Hypothetical predicted protein [Cloeon dipterum]
MRGPMPGPVQKCALSSGRSPSGARKSLPMSERQQMALVMQMYASDPANSNPCSSPPPLLSPTGGGRARMRNERGETPLHLAAIKGDILQTRRLLSRKADPNVADFAGWTPLHEACNHGHLEVARCLINANADINARGLDDETPLHDATRNGHIKLVELLLQHGADPHLKNSLGVAPRDINGPQVAELAYLFIEHSQQPPTTPRPASTHQQTPSEGQ